jgi:hypothetical protein
MRKVILLSALIVVTALLTSAGVALAASNIGYRDFSFAAPGVGVPTSMMAQSKLWFNDGTWWGVLFDRSTEEYHIYRYHWATHTWDDTGTLVDERNTSRADALWDGTYLYVASAGPNSASSAHSARISRYSYDPSTERYSLDEGFPVTVTKGGTEAIVLDKDTSDKVWATYTKNRRVYVTHTLGGNDSSWIAPFVPPVRGTAVDSDDVSSIVAFDSRTAAPKIGLMWSNQADDAVYFATHRDGEPNDAWRSETVVRGPGMVNDHINLKADSDGRVFAAVKNRRDQIRRKPNAPYNLLWVRDQEGTWTSHVFGRVRDDHTRPIVLIDEEHRYLYMAATDRDCTGGEIYYKRTSVDDISFEDGLGIPLIQGPNGKKVNDATSTKQNLYGVAGPMVVASDKTGDYHYNLIDPHENKEQ